MRRILLCLPVCLLIASDRPSAIMAPFVAKPRTASPSEAPIPSPEEFEALAKSNPVECLRASLRKYRKEVKCLHGMMEKQERLGTKLNPPETIEFWFRDEPHSAFLAWRSKPAGQADRVLFVEGANDNKMLVHPATAIARAVVGDVTARDPNSKEAKAGGRISIVDFGFRKALERQLGACEEQSKSGKSTLEYLGIKNLPEVNNRPHHMFRRTNEEPVGPEKIAKVEFGLDAVTWLQTCSHAFNDQGQLLGSYFFREVEINPTIADGQFEKAQLLK